MNHFNDFLFHSTKVLTKMSLYEKKKIYCFTYRYFKEAKNDYD